MDWKPDKINGRLFPERRFVSFFRRSDRFIFFSILADLILPSDVVLDLGAGRGRHADFEFGHQARLSKLKGRVAKVIGVDVDPVVQQNPTLDEAHVIAHDGRIPLADSSVDLIFSWAVLEHIVNPQVVAAEIDRVLKPGGWFCAYTPNKWGYVGICVRLIPNSFHAALLKIVQPGSRTERDVFPTVYRMNTLGTIERLFPKPKFEDRSFIFNGQPAYHFGTIVGARFWLAVMALLPYRMGQSLFVFVRKRGRES